MDSTGIMIFLSVILIALSAFFSASETSISGASRVRLRSYAEDGNKKAKRTLKLMDDFDKTISAILIGNNIVNIATSSIFTFIAVNLFGNGGVGIATAFTTVVVLIFGEIIPKTTAKANADSFSMFVSGPISAISFVFSPISSLLTGIKGVIVRTPVDEKPSITEEELKFIIEETKDEGVLEEQESQLAQSALEFDEIRLSQVLTPRVDMVALDIELTPEEMLETMLTQQFSRLPVYEEGIDNIIGILHERDFLSEYAKGNKPDVRKIMKKPEFMPENLKISHALAKMQKGKFQLALVTDQYGGTLGVVTMEDILEELVGEIWDERDEVLLMIEPAGDDKYKVNGLAELEDLLEEFDIDKDDVESESNTVGGWVCDRMGKIPQQGESFTADNLKITVTGVDNVRVTEVMAELLPQSETDED